MKTKFSLVTLSFILLAVTACAMQPTSAQLATPPAVPTPEAGKATVTGRIYSTTNKGPIAPAVWLAEVFGTDTEKYYLLDQSNSPSRYADKNGYFVITNVKPQEYVIIVGQPEGENEVIKDETGKAKIWTVPADQVLNVGQLNVTLNR